LLLPKLNPIEPPWYGPVCPVVWEGRRREVSPYPDLRRFSATQPSRRERLFLPQSGPRQAHIRAMPEHEEKSFRPLSIHGV
jgi:hypothetical protein